MIHVFRLMCLAWLAMAVNWASVDSWTHAAITACFGVGCYALGEQFNKENA